MRCGWRELWVTGVVALVSCVLVGRAWPTAPGSQGGTRAAYRPAREREKGGAVGDARSRAGAEGACFVLAAGEDEDAKGSAHGLSSLLERP